MEVCPSPSSVTTVRTAQLKLQSFRARGLSEDHVQSLIAAEGRWPPILVASDGMTVIDGAHRVEAAWYLGLQTMCCEIFLGVSEGMYLEFIRQNALHGLPLARAEREQAATTLLGKHPDWSNRRIAQFCGVSSHTVAALRISVVASGTASESSGQPPRRVGLDGRRRPVDSSRLQERITAEIERRPLGSLREVAAAAGASPETVRAVKRRREAGAHVAPREANGLGATTLWQCDRALHDMDAGPQFLSWLDRTAVGDNWQEHAGRVPLSRVYEIAEEARRRASVWQSFADALEQRAQPGARY